MILSQDTQKFIDIIDQYSEGTLRKKQDIALIFEVAASTNNPDLIFKLLMTATSIWNLSEKLKKVSSDSQGVELLHNEFEKALDYLKNELTSLLQYFDELIQNRFQDVYLQMTKGCVLNIIDLSHDFAIIKKLQNDQKSQK